MSSNYLVQTVLKHANGLPEDSVVNTWSCFTLATGDLTALQEFVDALKAFYSEIEDRLASTLSGDVEFRCYDRQDAEPRTPVLTDTSTIAPGGTTLPHEVALCLSFQGIKISGLPQARRRGRVYLGPFMSEANVGSTGRPSGTTISLIVAAADTLLDASDASGDWEWTIWSTVDDAAVPVNDGWVDNSWDTQRRRGEAATARTLFSV